MLQDGVYLRNGGPAYSVQSFLPESPEELRSREGPLTKVQFIASGDQNPSGGLLLIEGEHRKLTPTSWQQLASLLEFPANYAEKVEPTLRREIVHYHLSKTEEWCRFFYAGDQILSIIPKNQFCVSETDALLALSTIPGVVCYLSKREQILDVVVQMHEAVPWGAYHFGLRLRCSATGVLRPTLDLVVLKGQHFFLADVPDAYFKATKRWGQSIMFKDMIRNAQLEMLTLVGSVQRRLEVVRTRRYMDPEHHLRKFAKEFGFSGSIPLEETLQKWRRSVPNAVGIYSGMAFVDAAMEVGTSLRGTKKEYAWSSAIGKYVGAKDEVTGR